MRPSEDGSKERAGGRSALASSGAEPRPGAPVSMPSLPRCPSRSSCACSSSAASFLVRAASRPAAARDSRSGTRSRARCRPAPRGRGRHRGRGAARRGRGAAARADARAPRPPMSASAERTAGPRQPCLRRFVHPATVSTRFTRAHPTGLTGSAQPFARDCRAAPRRSRRRSPTPTNAAVLSREGGDGANKPTARRTPLPRKSGVSDLRHHLPNPGTPGLGAGEVELARQRRPGEGTRPGVPYPGTSPHPVSFATRPLPHAERRSPRHPRWSFREGHRAKRERGGGRRTKARRDPASAWRRRPSVFFMSRCARKSRFARQPATGTSRGHAASMSVRAKSSPLNRSGTRSARAQAYDRQSARLSRAG